MKSSKAARERDAPGQFSHAGTLSLMCGKISPPPMRRDNTQPAP